MTRPNIVSWAAVLIAVVGCDPAARGDAILDIATSTGFADSISISGTEIPGQGMLYSTQVLTEDFTLSANYLGQPDNIMLGGGLQLTNCSNSEISFVIGFLLPVAASTPAMWDWAASLSLSISGFDASVQTLTGQSIWTAAIGSQVMGSMLADPFDLSVAGAGTAVASAISNGLIDHDGSTTFSVRYAFTLSSGDTLNIGGSVGFVPTPGTLALLAIASMAGCRRRRRESQPAQNDS